MKRKFLTDLGITDTDVMKQIIDYHQGVARGLKEDAAALLEELSAAKSKIKELEISQSADSNGEDWKARYEEIKGEFDTYKESEAAEKTAAAKKTALHKALKAEGASEKIIELLESKFDIAQMELEGDKIKSWEELVKPVKEQFSAVFGTIETVGISPANPPRNHNNPYGGKTVLELMVEANADPSKTESILKQIENRRKNND